MKPSIQLRLTQHLTMTPQLQQAIRLLQLSTLDLKQEIQDALESNPLLETVEEGEIREQGRLDALGSRGDTEGPAGAAGEGADGGTGPDDRDYDGRDAEPELQAVPSDLPQDLPVDSGWEDVYDPVLPPSSGSRDEESTDFYAQRSAAQTLVDHLVWQLNLTRFSDTDRAIATTIIDAISDDGY